MTQKAMIWNVILGVSFTSIYCVEWTKWWQYVARFFLRSITVPLKKERPSIDDKSYIESATARFLESYKKSDQDAYNTSIEPVFYLGDEYKEAVKHAGNDLEKAWQRRILMETTPRGNVIMFYDAYKLAFSYYADVFIPYPILNAVAMNYALTYKCRDFFMDETVIPKEHSSALHRLLARTDDKDQEAAQQKKEEMRELIRAGPFIKPKKKDPTTETKAKTETNLETKIKDVVTTRILCLGNIKNFRPLISTAMKVKISKNIPTSYGDFKSWKNLKKDPEDSSPLSF